MGDKHNILIYIGYFLPGYKAGGPIQSISNLVSHTSTFFDYYIVTRSRDLGDRFDYPDIIVNSWCRLDECSVYYGNRYKSINEYSRIRNYVTPKVVIINSFFSVKFGIIPTIIHLFHRDKIVICPRGELDIGALSIKKFKKSAFLLLYRLFGIQKRVFWLATSEMELKNIKYQFRNRCNVYLTTNFSKIVPKPKSKVLQQGEQVHLLFFSRISEKKNLLLLLDWFRHAPSNYQLTIAGPIESNTYWDKCESILRELHNVEYIGPVDHDKIDVLFSEVHFFILPTSGENYGHAIVEALSQSTPVIISKFTPWRDIYDFGCGYEMDLTISGFSDVISKINTMSSIAYEKMVAKASDYYHTRISANQINEINKFVNDLEGIINE